MVKPGATVIDVAIIRNGGRLMGDADESVWRVAGAMTPVPGGVGPCTIAMLLRNTLTAFYNQRLAD
jgi:methylenetetrahydrofolate dehydrogenase (NADP+)/methenyltetrahydrofolate cyclohydrolase